MPRTKVEKKKAKRKIKQKERQQRSVRALLREKVEFLVDEALWFMDEGQLDKALFYLEKVLRLDPKNEECLQELGRLGYLMKRPDIELSSLLRLYNYGLIKPDQMPLLCHLLEQNGKYKQALCVIQETLKIISKIKARGKNALRESLIKSQKHCQAQLETTQKLAAINSPIETVREANRQRESKDIIAHPENANIPENHIDKSPLPEIPISIQVDTESFKEALANGNPASLENYELTLEGHRIRFKETFESLICLNSLKNVRSFWFQKETARKILKTFHGRALLSDEVGLGKTIEALMVLKEYIQRGMVKSAIILTPTPLVSQWKEEMKVKFGLNFPSTDDTDYRTWDQSFWKEAFILASINIAKSKKNFPIVTQREYDMVIVDEAHHLKDKNTLNWKLVNALKKRFLLLLTATPVENNLMELYNLVTLLKPGQLKTASDFRQKFMTRGDPTDPRNRGHLKDLLGQVMIRNTRALAKIDIPPRFAQTIKVDPDTSEIELYQKITALIKDINKTNGSGHRLLLKNLLAEAGSSPRAVRLTLSRILARQDMLLEHEQRLHAISNLCGSIHTTSKDRLLFKLIRSYPGKKILFVKYHGTLDHVSEFLAGKGISHSLFHGKMDNRSKDEQIQSFKEEKDILVTTEIGGEGRNLQFCHQMLNYDLPWNPMKIEQRIGRIHRIGQEQEVMIYNLCAAESVEDYILEILDRKINMFEMVIGEIDMILGRIKGEQDFSEKVYDIWVNSGSEEERKTAFGQLGSMLKRAKTSYQKSKELDEKLFGENYEL
ncbi:MAG: DEAD/DEAH box helicase family protein [Deltaproteobacteria bacterium]|nr:DEAD/DEAH box helicase family protein [Deltaproteobacteria bacterium]